MHAVSVDIDDMSSAGAGLAEIVRGEAQSLGFGELKPEQLSAVEAFVGGLQDVFVSLPTGFGKSLCYALIPKVLDRIRGLEKKCIALVISPLRSLIEDQVSAFNARGLAAAYVGSEDSAVRDGIKQGKYQLVFACPEMFFCNAEVRSMLATPIYASNLLAFVVDEAHCIRKW